MHPQNVFLLTTEICRITRGAFEQSAIMPLLLVVFYLLGKPQLFDRGLQAHRMSTMYYTDCTEVSHFQAKIANLKGAGRAIVSQSQDLQSYDLGADDMILFLFKGVKWHNSLPDVLPANPSEPRSDKGYYGSLAMLVRDELKLAPNQNGRGKATPPRNVGLIVWL